MESDKIIGQSFALANNECKETLSLEILIIAWFDHELLDWDIEVVSLSLSEHLVLIFVVLLWFHQWLFLWWFCLCDHLLWIASCAKERMQAARGWVEWRRRRLRLRFVAVV